MAKKRKHGRPTKIESIIWAMEQARDEIGQIAVDEMVSAFREVVLIFKDKDVQPSVRVTAYKQIRAEADAWYEENVEDEKDPKIETKDKAEDDDVYDAPLLGTTYTSHTETH